MWTDPTRSGPSQRPFQARESKGGHLGARMTSGGGSPLLVEARANLERMGAHQRVGSRLRAKCWWGAPGICAAIASWSARGSSESRAPQAIRVGAEMGPVSSGGSAASSPSNASRQTRAGTLRFSRQSTSMIASGTSHPTIPSLSSRTNAASIGSSSAATTSAKGGPRSAQAAGRAEQRQTQDPLGRRWRTAEPRTPRSMRLRARLRAA